MSGHPRSATAPSGEFAHRLARLGSSNRDGYAIGGSSAENCAREVALALPSPGVRTFICRPGHAAAHLDH